MTSASLKKLGEFGWIDRIRRRTGKSRSVIVGIGDDTAVLRNNPRKETLLTTDMLVEGRHFLLGEASLEEIGWKAMAVNLSDIAAMGGVPIAAVVAVGLPASFELAQADALFKGLSRAAGRFGVTIAGGDTNRSDKLVVAVTLLGEVEPGRAVLRSGAKPGDAVWVSGALGGSLASKRHLRFTPRVRESLWLVSRFKINAMMDLSDGLSSDLRRLASESGVGIRIEGAHVPVSPDAKSLGAALSDGEDFELLFTLSPAESDRLSASKSKPVRMTRIGKVTSQQKGITIIDANGKERVLEEKGFNHFQSY